ncbi:hypothetical protein [Streptomyces scopuliridis]|uniref:hypothetical protein n=1 Tax=Streptomyces scopuliridis TaxID=452529 RepID=UPI00342DC0A8
MTGPSMGDAQRRISITSDPVSTRILLDDVDISRSVQGYTIEHRVMQPPVVVLYAHPCAGAAFDGMAHVAVAQPQAEDPGETVAGFLSNIDAATLERAALDRPDLGGGKHDVTRAILRQLADWAQGAS